MHGDWISTFLCLLSNPMFMELEILLIWLVHLDMLHRYVSCSPRLLDLHNRGIPNPWVPTQRKSCQTLSTQLAAVMGKASIFQKEFVFFRTIVLIISHFAMLTDLSKERFEFLVVPNWSNHRWTFKSCLGYE